MAKGGRREGAGRPKGKPNAVTADVRELAQQYGPQALATLAKIMNDDGSPEAARVAASKELLDRAYGKSLQGLEHTGKGGGPIESVTGQLSPEDTKAIWGQIKDDLDGEQEGD